VLRRRAATVLSGPERRRRWTRAEKLRLIEETLAPEATVAEVARRYDVHPNLLHSWRRQAQQGVLTGGAGASPAPADATDFAAVAIEPPVPSLPASGRTAAGSMIEIEFAAGVRMRITGPVESSTVLALIRLLAKSKRRR
jgi:transposase